MVNPFPYRNRSYIPELDDESRSSLSRSLSPLDFDPLPESEEDALQDETLTDGEEPAGEKRTEAEMEEVEREPDASNETYEIDLILDHRDSSDGSREYLVAWSSYSAGFNTWEPEEELGKTSHRVTEYWANNAPRTSSRKRKKDKSKEKKARFRRKINELTLIDVVRLTDEEKRQAVLRMVGQDRLHWATWDGAVARIARIDERQGTNLVSIDFKDGFRFQYDFDVVSERCPKLLCAFVNDNFRLNFEERRSRSAEGEEDPESRSSSTIVLKQSLSSSGNSQDTLMSE